MKLDVKSMLFVATIFFAVSCEDDSTSSAPDVTGHWRGESGPNLEYQELTLIDSDGIITGTAISKRPGNSATPGTVEGDRPRSDRYVTLTIIEENWTWEFWGGFEGDSIPGSMTSEERLGSTSNPIIYTYRKIKE